MVYWFDIEKVNALSKQIVRKTICSSGLRLYLVSDSIRNSIGDYRDKSANDFEMERKDKMKHGGDIAKPETYGFPDRMTKRWPASG
jgi:hypothetical protein